MKLWWLSFAGPDRFLGACMVYAFTFFEAVKVAHALGINPRGEVLGREIKEVALVSEWPKERLLSKAEIEAL